MAEFRDSSSTYAELSDFDLRLILIRHRMKDLVGIGPWQDRWLFYPFADMSEPEKAICWLTGLGDRSYSADHLARLYVRATLHGIDRFFMQVRRRISPLERPMGSASSEGRKWHGYTAAPTTRPWSESCWTSSGFSITTWSVERTSKHQQCGWVWRGSLQA